MHHLFGAVQVPGLIADGIAFSRRSLPQSFPGHLPPEDGGTELMAGGEEEGEGEDSEMGGLVGSSSSERRGKEKKRSRPKHEKKKKSPKPKPQSPPPPPQVKPPTRQHPQ